MAADVAGHFPILRKPESGWQEADSATPPPPSPPSLSLLLLFLLAGKQQLSGHLVLDKQSNQIALSKARLLEHSQGWLQASAGKDCSSVVRALQEENSRKLAALQELQQTAQALQTDLQQYAENDPERVEAISEVSSIRTCSIKLLSFLLFRTPIDHPQHAAQSTPFASCLCARLLCCMNGQDQAASEKRLGLAGPHGSYVRHAVPCLQQGARLCCSLSASGEIIERSH